MHIRHSLRLILITSVLKLGILVKATVILGAKTACFSATSCISPLIGAYNAVPVILSIFGGLFCAKFFFFGSFPLHFLAYHVPGLCAALFWARPEWRLGIVIPVVCFVLFVVHPVGAGAWVYTGYWLVPVVMSLIPLILSSASVASTYRRTLGTSLSATFVAHAVGSVIWLYTVPMTSEQWIALIPIVAIERFSFALIMTGICFVIEYVRELDLKKHVSLFRFLVLSR